MPKGFERCVERGGRVRTVSGPSEEHDLEEGEYRRLCFIDGEMYRGHVKQKGD